MESDLNPKEVEQTFDKLLELNSDLYNYAQRESQSADRRRQLQTSKDIELMTIISKSMELIK